MALIDEYAGKTDLDTRFDEMHGYIDTAVDTLTEEMDRQVKEVRGDIARLQQETNNRFDEVMQELREIKGRLP